MSSFRAADALALAEFLLICCEQLIGTSLTPTQSLLNSALRFNNENDNKTFADKKQKARHFIAVRRKHVASTARSSPRPPSTITAIAGHKPKAAAARTTAARSAP
jgi:hypothetical protein